MLHAHSMAEPRVRERERDHELAANRTLGGSHTSTDVGKPSKPTNTLLRPVSDVRSLPLNEITGAASSLGSCSRYAGYTMIEQVSWLASKRDCLNRLYTLIQRNGGLHNASTRDSSAFREPVRTQGSRRPASAINSASFCKASAASRRCTTPMQMSSGSQYLSICVYQIESQAIPPIPASREAIVGTQ